MIRAILAALQLAACATAPDPGVPTQHAGNGWSWWSGGAFAGVASDGSFTFPTGDPALNHVDYVARAHSGPLIPPGSSPDGSSRGQPGTPAPGVVTVRYRVDGSAALAPNTTGFKCPCGVPVLHLIFAVPNYDVYDTTPTFLTQRWWSVTGSLSPGEHTLTVPLDPAQWLDVNGQHGDTQLAGFKAALANVGSVGVTFGASQGPAGHGVSAPLPGSSADASSRGHVTFTIESLEAQ